MKFFGHLAIFSLFIQMLFSCSTSVEQDENGCAFIHDSLQYRVEFFAEGTVRILSLPQNNTLKTQRLVVDADKPRYQKFTVKENKQTLTFSTSLLTVKFDKTKAAFSFYENKDERLLLKEKDKQARSFKPVIAGGENALEVTQRFIPTPNEAIYGLGQYQDGKLNYRGDSVRMVQSNMDIVNPFLVSTNGYGILWDNYSHTDFVDNQDGYSFTSEVGDASDYYFVYGKNMDEVIAGYRELTGHAPMFGKWVYGFWQSKERYKSFEELENVVKEYRKRQIPLDNIVQDWEYWGNKSKWNSLKFDEKLFPHPQEAIKRLHQENVHLMVSVWPGFGPQTEVYQELDQLGALFDEPTWAGYKVFDAYNPKARDIVWKYLKSGLYDKGVDAWWMDAVEPSFREGFTQEKQEEKTKSAGKTYIGSFHRYLNVYSLELLKDLYNRLRNENDQKRVFIFTRSAFASQQRYGTALWSGDVSASWENMHKQLTAGLNISMSGIPYWTSDTGGFFVTERGAQYPQGLKSDDYKELYSRWFQFSAFTPIFRAHGTNIPREVWQFGEKGTPYYNNQFKFIRLRYAMLPYIYSLSERVTHEGYTLMRGLAMDFTTDQHALHIDNSYMFGPAILVRPVFHPKKEEPVIDTYLPEHAGKYWYDFYTNEAFKGGDTVSQPNKLDVIPLYVKAGSILMFAPVSQYTAQQPNDLFELCVYSGQNASFTWYNDEGDSYNYEKGQSARVPIHWDETSRTLTLQKREGHYPGMPKEVYMFVKLFFPTHALPVVKEIVYKGEEIKLKF